MYLKKNNLSALKLDKIKHRLENCLHLFFSQGKMICVYNQNQRLYETKTH